MPHMYIPLHSHQSVLQPSLHSSLIQPMHYVLENSTFCYRLWSSVVVVVYPMLSMEFHSCGCLVINLELLVCRARGLGFETMSHICDAKLSEFDSAILWLFIVGECHWRSWPWNYIVESSERQEHLYDLVTIFPDAINSWNLLLLTARAYFGVMSLRINNKSS